LIADALKFILDFLIFYDILLYYKIINNNNKDIQQKLKTRREEDDDEVKKICEESEKKEQELSKQLKFHVSCLVYACLAIVYWARKHGFCDELK
jgi:hypothetical protein